MFRRSLAFLIIASLTGCVGLSLNTEERSLSSAVDDLVSVAKNRLLKGARPASVERLKMCSVVLWQHEEPTKTIQFAVVRMSRAGLRVRLGRELGN